VGPNVSLQQALTSAQNSGYNTEIILPAGDYTLDSVATFTSAAGQDITMQQMCNYLTSPKAILVILV